MSRESDEGRAIIMKINRILGIHFEQFFLTGSIYIYIYMVLLIWYDHIALRQLD